MLNTKQRRAFQHAARHLPVNVRRAESNHYDSLTQTIFLRHDATNYERSHESMHFVQHREKSFAFRAALALSARLCGLPLFPFVRNIARFFAESQADRMTRNAMLSYGVWNEQSERESQALIDHYFSRIFRP